MYTTANPPLPFVVHYSLTRRQRLAYELFPWLPALAGTLGFAFGAAYLCWAVHPVLGLFFLLPVVVYRGLFAFLWSLLRQSRLPVELQVDQSHLRWQMTAQPPHYLPVDGIIQVCRTNDPNMWNILHHNGMVIPVPQSALTAEQLAYLRQLALRAARQRRQQVNATAAGHD
jgi:hypothetical protein